MAKKFLLSGILVIIISSFLMRCIIKSESISPKKDTIPNINNVNTILGNNTFNTTLGSIYFPLIYDDKMPSIKGKCDCDTVPACNYYVVSGTFEETKNFKGNAAFSLFFKSKPSSSRAFNIIPYIVDSTNTLKYSLTDTSVFLLVSELRKTQKSWTGNKGFVDVDASGEIIKVEFNRIKGQNMSNFSDTTLFSGNLQCR
jgi:hypothetical protein